MAAEMKWFSAEVAPAGGVTMQAVHCRVASLFLTFLALSSHVFGSTTEKEYSKVSQDLATGTVLEEFSVGSVQKCSIRCLKHDFCVSFSYDDVTSSCKLGGLQAEYGNGAPGTGSQVYDQVVDCEEGWVANPHRNSCLWLEATTPLTAVHAKIKCGEMNAALAIFDSEAAANWFYFMRTIHPVWKEQYFVIVGGKKDVDTDTWMWDNGSTDQLSAADFANGSPNSDTNSDYCLNHFENSWGPGWDDLDCIGVALPYLCEKALN